MIFALVTPDTLVKYLKGFFRIVLKMKALHASVSLRPFAYGQALRCQSIYQRGYEPGQARPRCSKRHTYRYTL